MGVVSPHPAILWEIYWVSYNLTQFWCSLPGGNINPIVKSLVETTTHFRCQSQVVGPQATYNFFPTWLQIQGSQDLLLLGFNYLPEQPTELKETLTYAYQFVVRIYDKEYRWTARWRDTQGEVWEGTNCGSFCLQSWDVSHPSYVGMFYLETLWTWYTNNWYFRPFIL